MRLLVKLILIVVGLGAGYHVFQRSEIQELFKESTRDGDPLAFLEDLPEIKPKPRSERPAVRRKPRASLAQAEAAPGPDVAVEIEQSDTAPEYLNQVPNDQLRTVLMQILAAKKLAQGVSLSVSDSVISVTGEVDSAEKRQQILDIVDRGREARRLDRQFLAVSPDR